MGRSAGIAGRALVVTALCLAGVLPATAASAATSCHAINAKGVGQDLGAGQTTADIQGGGLLNGTTAGSFVIGSITGSVASISGTVTFTTKRATLVVTVQGTFDVASGAFTASGPVTAATGKLAGATGTLALSGTQDLLTGAFIETVTGNICADLSP